MVSKSMAAVLRGESSTEHKKFEEACDKFGLPRNSSKRLAGALKGSLQGGELLSEEGVFMLDINKMQMNVAMCLALSSMHKWGRKEISGVVGRLVFGGAFRRPLLSALSAVFHLNQKGGVQLVPSEEAYDEILVFFGVAAGLHQCESKTGKGNSCYRCFPYWCRELHREKVQITSGRGGHEQCLHRLPSGHRRAWRVGSSNGVPMAMRFKNLLFGLLAESSQILPLFRECNSCVLGEMVRAKGSDK